MLSTQKGKADRPRLFAALKRRRLLYDKRGSAAVEFAIVAPIFLVMMFSMFEIGWFYFANSVVDASVADAARLIKTGQLQQSSGTAEEHSDALFEGICDVLDKFGDCNDRLTVEVKKYASFEELSDDTAPATCADAPPGDIDAIEFEPGTESEIVRVRICFLYTTVNPIVGMKHIKAVKLGESGGNERRLISIMIFRNEPYEKNTGTS